MAAASGDHLTHHRPSVGLALILGASSYVLLLAAMVAFLGAASPPAHLELAFTDDPGRFALYRLAFVSAFLLGFALVPVLVLLVVARGEVAVTDLLGYTLFGTATVLLSLAFLERPGVWRWLGSALFACGLTSVAAFASLGAGMETLHFVLSISSAVLTLPVAGAAVLVGRRLRAVPTGPDALP